MKAIHYSTVRQNLSKLMNQVCEEHEPLIITRKTLHNNVVMMSLEDFNSIEETAYLLKSPKNAKLLRESLKQYKQGKYQERELIE
jgi:antitoxin YefM